MDSQVTYVVCGIDEGGYGWHLQWRYLTPEAAVERADLEAEDNPQVWIEKRIEHAEIIWSSSGPIAPPDLALIPV